MLIRFVVNNLFSFGKQKEFNMLPNPRLGTLDNHKYRNRAKEIELLKMAAIYGANGAGKSNLIKSLDLLKKILTKEDPISRVKGNEFKFKNEKNDDKQLFAVEFLQENESFYYAIEIDRNNIATEELYLSGLGKSEDRLIYERSTTSDGITTIKFSESFEKDEKSQILKQVLLEDFVKPDQPILKLISNRDNEYLKVVKKAFKWFSNSLQIITPESQPHALAHRMEIDSKFKTYAEEIMCSFNVGITSIVSEKREIHEFFGEDGGNEVEELIKNLENTPNKMIGLRSRRGDEIVLVKEGDKVFAKQLKLEHIGKKKQKVIFDLDEESDGTIRLLDFIPAFQDLFTKDKVYLIDEIERSIHPLLIKELIKRFSLDDQTAGQLIFTTHETNLLDQLFFRQDEIWFAEKDKSGSTDLYSLSDFKEHKTIDIRKGYLNGRYGSIPFLGNLEDLNWHKYDTQE